MAKLTNFAAIEEMPIQRDMNEQEAEALDFYQDYVEWEEAGERDEPWVAEKLLSAFKHVCRKCGNPKHPDRDLCDACKIDEAEAQMIARRPQ